VVRWQHGPGQKNPLAKALSLLTTNGIQKEASLLNRVGPVGDYYPKNIWVIQRRPHRKA
jgi:hypothetical protein